MKGIIAVLFALICMAGISGCDTQAQKDKLKQDELKLDAQFSENFRDLNVRKHAAYVEAAENALGPQAKLTLEQCYSDGYDSVLTDDHKFTNDPKLGPKYVAKCEKIRKSLDTYFDKADKAHQKEISQ